jgi:hypothetical protein
VHLIINVPLTFASRGRGGWEIGIPMPEALNCIEGRCPKTQQGQTVYRVYRDLAQIS